MNRRSRIGLSGCALAAVMLLARTAWAAPAPGQDDVARKWARPAILVFAAASLTDVLESWERISASHGIGVKFVFAASSVLARRSRRGRRADIFFSADRDWMDYLQTRKLIQAESPTGPPRQPAGSGRTGRKYSQFEDRTQFELASALGKGRLARRPDSVPPGAMPAQPSRRSECGVGWRIHRAGRNVRAALAFVERGEVPLGNRHRTDALSDKGVRIVDTFPAESIRHYLSDCAHRRCEKRCRTIRGLPGKAAVGAVSSDRIHGADASREPSP